MKAFKCTADCFKEKGNNVIRVPGELGHGETHLNCKRMIDITFWKCCCLMTTECQNKVSEDICYDTKSDNCQQRNRHSLFISWEMRQVSKVNSNPVISQLDIFTSCPENIFLPSGRCSKSISKLERKHWEKKNHTPKPLIEMPTQFQEAPKLPVFMDLQNAQITNPVLFLTSEEVWRRSLGSPYADFIYTQTGDQRDHYSSDVSVVK